MKSLLDSINFSLIRTLSVSFFSLSVIIIIGAFLWAWSDLPPLDVLENPRLNLSTEILSTDGQSLGNFFEEENRVFVPLHNIATEVSSALIPTEDVRFYTHSGVDPKSILAIFKDLIIYQRMRGGSTITQQLARNLYDTVGKDRTLSRKIKEMMVAFILERKFTKEEILEAYLNTASFYGNTYGVEMGARALFGKSASDLDMKEAALMVGLLKGPSYYNPLRFPERAKKRRNVVFSQMKKYKLLSESKSKKLLKTELGLKPGSLSASNKLNGYYKSIIKAELRRLTEEEGLEIDLYRDGLKVITTLDSRYQAHAEAAVREHLTEYQKVFKAEMKKRKMPWDVTPAILEKAVSATPRYISAKRAGTSSAQIKKEFATKVPMKLWTWDGQIEGNYSPLDSVKHYLAFLETGFMSVDPRTGAIKSWVGGINYGLWQYDHVAQGKRQVGSTFKPIVYAAALNEEMIRPCEEVIDIPVSITLSNGKTWSPKNSGNEYSGRIDYKECLARSINGCAAQVMKKIGPEKVCEFAYNAGIESKLNCVPSLCLGTTDLTLKELVGFYTAVSNQGNFSKPYLIEKIVDRNGKLIKQYNTKRKSSMTAQTAYSLSEMMKAGVDMDNGTGHSLRTKFNLKGTFGGKTGTTQDNSDGWFIGVTPKLVAGVWVGCSDRRVRFARTYYGQGAKMALPIYGKFIQKISKDKDIRFTTGEFTSPEGYDIDVSCDPKDEKIRPKSVLGDFD